MCIEHEHGMNTRGIFSEYASNSLGTLGRKGDLTGFGLLYKDVYGSV
jgi:hypothetical protein